MVQKFLDVIKYGKHFADSQLSENGMVNISNWGWSTFTKSAAKLPITAKWLTCLGRVRRCNTRWRGPKWPNTFCTAKSSFKMWLIHGNEQLIGLNHPLDGIPNPKYELLHWLNFVSQREGILAFNQDKCWHLVICLGLLSSIANKSKNDKYRLRKQTNAYSALVNSKLETFLMLLQLILLLIPGNRTCQWPFFVQLGFSFEWNGWQTSSGSLILEQADKMSSGSPNDVDTFSVKSQLIYLNTEH